MSANKVRDRGIAAERYFALRLQRAAGRVSSAIFQNLVTSTGRVRDNNFGFDILVGDEADGVALVGESKRRKVTFGAEALRQLAQLFRISVEWEREPAFCVALADNADDWIETKKGKRRLPKRWVMFELSYAEKLLRTLRLVNTLRRESETFNNLWIGADLRDAMEQTKVIGEDND